MKTRVFLLATIIVTCAVTLLSGREPSSVPTNGAQDYGCAVIAVNIPTQARPVGVLQIPSPAANFIAIGLWARHSWHHFWGETLDRQHCVWSADSGEK
jgi:hypothetical protein